MPISSWCTFLPIHFVPSVTFSQTTPPGIAPVEYDLLPLVQLQQGPRAAQSPSTWPQTTMQKRKSPNSSLDPTHRHPQHRPCLGTLRGKERCCGLPLPGSQVIKSWIAKSKEVVPVSIYAPHTSLTPISAYSAHHNPPSTRQSQTTHPSLGAAR